VIFIYGSPGNDSTGGASSFCVAVDIPLGTHRFQRALGKGLIEKKWVTCRRRAGSYAYQVRAQNFDGHPIQYATLPGTFTAFIVAAQAFMEEDRLCKKSP
jgi:hypothetical protein